MRQWSPNYIQLPFGALSSLEEVKPQEPRYLLLASKILLIHQYTTIDFAPASLTVLNF